MLQFLLLAFIRQAILESGIRLDGRDVDSYRDIDIKLERSECSSISEVRFDDTLVITAVSGEIVSPYPDRPVEGILQFNVNISTHTELSGITHWELSRMFERSIKESEAIDTESLCIVGGEKVWQISCETRVIDGSGGNLIDVCMLSVMSALRAFRKPDVSIIPTINLLHTEENLKLSIDKNSSSKKQISNNNILIHHSNDREPLPLALHHTPLAVTFGIIKFDTVPTSLTSGSQVHKHYRQYYSHFCLLYFGCNANNYLMIL